MVETYAGLTGLRPANLDWLFAYNLFRLAAICQGIGGRVRDGTAASDHARQMAVHAPLLAEGALAFARKAGV
jgi:aminoglycoside phosphotransferase (APT) family kinase protein